MPADLGVAHADLTALQLTVATSASELGKICAIIKCSFSPDFDLNFTAVCLRLRHFKLQRSISMVSPNSSGGESDHFHGLLQFLVGVFDCLDSAFTTFI